VSDDELIKFYRARLAEDEAAAKTVRPGDWDGDAWAEFGTDVCVHFQRHDPARVLREVEVGQKLIADYEQASEALGEQIAEREQDAMPTVILTESGPAYAPERVEEIVREVGTAALVATTLGQEVARRATVWCDHPDYLQEWAP
jgi:hypothetical protein